MTSGPTRRALLACATALHLLAGCGARSGLRVEPRTASDAALDAVVRDALDADAPVDVRFDVPLDLRADLPPDVPPFDCRPDPATRCDDRNACTTDRCQPDGACAHEPMRCDDGDPCTADTCQPASGCAFPRVECGGCADGQRDAFRDLARYPNIAGCAGGFDVPGLAREGSPMCGRAAGDDGPNPTGARCSATDLCAAGFHVCRSAAEVAARSPDGCRGAADGAPSSFWATRQTGPGCLECATGTAPDCTALDCRSSCAPTPRTTNDIFGCGSVGSPPRASCGVLDRSGNNLCGALPSPWFCAGAQPDADTHESEYVIKRGPAAGGVLCCRD